MPISCDPEQRRRTLDERGLDFDDAPHVIAGPTSEVEGRRVDHGERRILCFGMPRDRMVVVGCTPRG